MHISSAGTGGVHPEPPVLTANVTSNLNLAGPAAPVGDSVGFLLEQLTAAPVAQLISGLAASHVVPDATVITNLLHTAGAAIAEGNITLALASLKELVHRSPEHLETLAVEPSLAPIRGQVADLLNRVSGAARVDAETRLAAATHLVESGKPHGGRSGEWTPHEVLPVASQLIESGRYPNFLIATDLSQSVINYYGGIDVPAPVPAPNARPSLQWDEALETLKKKRPLLLFLLSALLGVIAAIAAGLEIWTVELSFEVWGAGSAGLLGYGTYKRLQDNPSR